MSEKVIFWMLAVLSFAALSSLHAQTTGKVYRVGWLYNGLSSSTVFLDTLRRELRELGYTEGRNLRFELRSAEEKPERLAALADELVRLNVDVIVTGGPADGLTAKKATKTIPIVIGDTVSDPVARGLVDSLARPGGNVTGFYTMADVLPGKRLEVLKEAIPNLTRVAILLHDSSAGADQWTESQRVTRQLGLQLHRMVIANVDDYDATFKAAVNAGSRAIAVTRHRLVHAPMNQKRIIAAAAKYRLPAIYYREDFVEQGGLMSYGADNEEPFKRLAAMIDKILKGAKPADIPVERSTKFEFVVNLKTAKTLNLTIPPEVLARAIKDAVPAFQASAKARAQAVLWLVSGGVLPASKAPAEARQSKTRLPVISGSPCYVEAGGLMSYGVILNDLKKRAAYYVDKILKGTKPADIPVEQPMKFEFIVNLKTAKQIGLTIPPNLLARADRVIL